MIKNLDSYSIRARLYPAFIVLSPIFILIVFSFYKNIQVVQIILAFLTTFGFAFLLAQLARDRGKRKEKELYKMWGGKPTTIFLRHREQFLNDVTRNRYSDKIKKLMSITLPTKEEEINDKKYADEMYDACTQFLIGKTRNIKKYNLLFLENISFGFRRNLWGMKPYAIIILLMCLIIQIAQNVYFIQNDIKSILNPELLIPVAIYLLLLGVWIFVFKPSWVREVGFEYAKRLYETLDQLDQK